MRNTFWIILLLGFVRCTPVKDSRVADTIGYSFDVEQQLEFTEIDYPDLLGVTMQLLQRDSLLFINEYHGDSLIHVFNLNTGRKEGDLVAAGNGPGKLKSPVELQIAGGNLWLFSRPLHMMNHIPLAEIAGEPRVVKDGLVRPEADCYIPLDGRRVVYSGFFTKRYALIDLAERDNVFEFGDYPDFWSEEKDFPAAAKAMFHQSRFALHAGKRLFASCSWFALEIYRYEPEGMKAPELVFRKQLGKYEYDYQAGSAVGTTMRPGSDLASVDIIGGEKYLYVLTQDAENKRHRNIMVLDWEGNPVKLLKSGRRITRLAIDEEAGMGYCIFEDPEDKLAQFSLN